MARLYGFRTTLSSRQGRFQNLGIFVVFVALAIPLGLSLRNIAWEANAQRIVKNALQAEFGDRARISQQDIDWSSDPLEISATVLTPRFIKNAEPGVQLRLDKSLGRRVHVALEQFRVGTEAGAAEQAQLAQARDAAQKAAEDAAVANVARRLALIAGIPSNEVTLDRDGQRAIAVARPLPGLTLQGYRDLEQRVADDAPDWTIALAPTPACPPRNPPDRRQTVRCRAAANRVDTMGRDPDRRARHPDRNKGRARRDHAAFATGRGSRRSARRYSRSRRYYRRTGPPASRPRPTRKR